MIPHSPGKMSRTSQNYPGAAYVPLTQIAQDLIRQNLQPGQLAIDATMGNGQDTSFLADLVGTAGMVFGFDIQRQALANTHQRLLDAGLNKHVTLILDGHENMQAHIPAWAQGRISAIMFNLGYLPGSDKHTITRPDTTLVAINTATWLLAPGAITTILVYRGHAGGQAEADTIKSLLDSMNQEQFRIELHPSPGPWLYVIEKLTLTSL